VTPQKQRQSQTKIADALFSKLVRSVGYCEMAGAFGIACNGNLQCSHIMPRDRRIVRFELINAICACAAHHWYTTNHDLEWHDWCREALGEEVYWELRRKAVAGGRVDYKTLIPDLRRRLEEAA
jgi:hypothetical protein